MPAFAFFERSADPADVPCITRVIEHRRIGFLRTEEPDIIRQFAFGVGPGIAISRLTSASDADCVWIEGEFLSVLCEIKDVRVAAGELVFGLLAKRVVPNDPVAKIETDLPAGDNAQISRKFIADRKIERAIGLEGAMNGLHPIGAELEIILGFAVIVVAVIEVADVEWGIGKNQVDPSLGAIVEGLD